MSKRGARRGQPDGEPGCYNKEFIEKTAKPIARLDASEASGFQSRSISHERLRLQRNRQSPERGDYSNLSTEKKPPISPDSSPRKKEFIPWPEPKPAFIPWPEPNPPHGNQH